jgi:hypothetical protein
MRIKFIGTKTELKNFLAKEVEKEEVAKDIYDKCELEAWKDHEFAFTIGKNIYDKCELEARKDHEEDITTSH